MKTINWNGEKLSLNICRYANNNRICILVNNENDCLCDLTTNLPYVYTKGDEVIFISNKAKKLGFDKEFINLGIIKDILGSVQYNAKEYDVVKLDLQELSKYDEFKFIKKYYKNEE